MFTSIIFTALLASSSALLTQAIVEPNEPGPGDVFKQGEKRHRVDDCMKDMAIELMTGPNSPMIHITTIATGQDGTVAGVLPPNAQIYFYQFTSGGSTNVTWTGRFTIAGADGSTTEPTDSEVANGQTVKFGKGALVDPSTAVAAPTFGSNSASASASASATGGSSANPASNSASAAATTPKSGASASNSASRAGNATGSAAGAEATGSSAAIAMGPIALDTRVWPIVAALTASALGFTILL
ncbi:hypothetical protein C8R43DRAFT_1087200 [Mycena crocata]|nr:hypothetical protein C8R43DRAFT_1087200 [Mycena crocata]